MMRYAETKMMRYAETKNKKPYDFLFFITLGSLHRFGCHQIGIAAADIFHKDAPANDRRTDLDLADFLHHQKDAAF